MRVWDIDIDNDLVVFYYPKNYIKKKTKEYFNVWHFIQNFNV